MLELFLKVPPLKKILEFQNQKNDYEICTNRKFRIKNQTNDWKLTKWTLSIRKNKLRAKLRANIRQELKGKKGSKTFLRVLERQNMQIQIIFELHTDDSKSKYSKGILKSAKKNYEKFNTKQTSTAGFLNFLTKFLT